MGGYSWRLSISFMASGVRSTPPAGASDVASTTEMPRCCAIGFTSRSIWAMIWS